METEKSASLALIQKMDGQSKRAKTSSNADGEEVLNVRKAVRFASKGRGGAALAREQAGGKTGRGGRRR